MYDKNPGKIDFGSSLARGSSYQESTVGTKRADEVDFIRGGSGGANQVQDFLV